MVRGHALPRRRERVRVTVDTRGPSCPELDGRDRKHARAGAEVEDVAFAQVELLQPQQGESCGRVVAAAEPERWADFHHHLGAARGSGRQVPGGRDDDPPDLYGPQLSLGSCRPVLIDDRRC